MCCENKTTKRNYFSWSSALLYDQIISPRSISSSIEMPESGYNRSPNIGHMCGLGFCKHGRSSLDIFEMVVFT